MDIHRSFFYYESRKDDREVEEAIRETAKYGEGFWKIFEIVRRDYKWNHKKVYRVYKAMNYGKPRNIRCDNGPEFIAKEFQTWCAGNDMKILFTQPGCPTQDSYIERFNGTYRRAILDAYIFRTIGEVRDMTDEWTFCYNNERSHETLNNMMPLEYRTKNGTKD